MNKIKQLRLDLKLTQQQLADKSDINIRQIQKIENAECDIDNIALKTGVALAKALNCTVEELI